MLPNSSNKTKRKRNATALKKIDRPHETDATRKGYDQGYPSHVVANTFFRVNLYNTQYYPYANDYIKNSPE